MRRSMLVGAGLGLLTCLPLLALLSLGERAAGLPNLPFVLFEWLTRGLPGPVVTFGIEAVVALVTGVGLGPTAAVAKLAEMALAVSGMLLGAAVFGATLALLGRRALPLRVAGALGGGLFALLGLLAVRSVFSPPAGVVASGAWVLALLGAWGTLLGWSVERLAAASPPGPSEPITSSGSRRRFLLGLASGSVGVFLAAVAMGRHWGRRDAPPPADLGETGTLPPPSSGPAASPAPERLARRIAPVRGTRAELTPTHDFYRVDINLTPPHLDADTWRLRIGGQVRDPRSLSLVDLQQLPQVSQVVTLECISNRLGGDLISTAVFTGVRLRSLLDRVGVQPRSPAVFLEAADEYFESVSPGDVLDERTLLVWAMNGAPLTAEHGFPLRLYVPNRFGMKQPKWITGLEVTERERLGYWAERGWSREATVQTTSVIDTVGTSMQLAQTPVVPLGGIAYAGARGIGRVEVQVDDGPWTATQLRSPPLSPLSWVQWRYDWPRQVGRHRFRVRAWDAAGVLQATEMRSPHPDGATGIHELTVQL